MKGKGEKERYTHLNASKEQHGDMKAFLSDQCKEIEENNRMGKTRELLKKDQRYQALPAMRETQVRSLGWEDPLVEGTATHSSILAWKIPMDRGACQATVHVVTKSQTQQHFSIAQGTVFISKANS